MEGNAIEEAWAKVELTLRERKEARIESDRAVQQGSEEPTAIESELSEKQEAYRRALADWWRLREAAGSQRDPRRTPPRRESRTSYRRRS